MHGCQGERSNEAGGNREFIKKLRASLRTKREQTFKK